MTTAATVKSVQGEAFARSPNGGMRRLAAGDTIQQGEVVITSLGGQVSLATIDGQMINVNSQESFKFGPESTQGTAPQAGEAAVQPVVAQPGEVDVAQILEQDAAAAGLAGGGENSGSSFVRLSRVTEEITPLAYEFPRELGSDILPAGGLVGGGAVATELPEEPEEPENLVPVANDDTANAIVIVTKHVDTVFDNSAAVMGAGEASFEKRLDNPPFQDKWLKSENSFDTTDFEGSFTIEDVSHGQAPSSEAFVVTRNFTAEEGDTFAFTVDQSGGDFSAHVYRYVEITKTNPQGKVTGTEWVWQLVGTIVEDGTNADGTYTYTFDSDGEYRVKFTVDGQNASADVDITTDGYFITGVIPLEDTYEYLSATGNVLTGDGADTLGDGDLADHKLAFDGDMDGDGVIDGLYGTLTLEMVDGKYTGAYTYTPNGEGGGTENFGYTLTDADGDSDTATLSINVGMKIIGTGYDDTLTGSAGNDIVVINLADQTAEVETDTLSGFNPGEDDLQISDLLTSNVSSVELGDTSNVVQITSDYGIHQLVFDTPDDAADILQSLQNQLGQTA